VAGRADLLVAGTFSPEATAPVISPVTFLAGDALETVAVFALQEAAACAFIPARLHSGVAFLLVTLFLLQQADAVAFEQLGCLGVTALFQTADPLTGLAFALVVPEEALFASRAFLKATLRLHRAARAVTILVEISGLALWASFPLAHLASSVAGATALEEPGFLTSSACPLCTALLERVAAAFAVDTEALARLTFSVGRALGKAAPCLIREASTGLLPPAPGLAVTAAYAFAASLLPDTSVCIVRPFFARVAVRDFTFVFSAVAERSIPRVVCGAIIGGLHGIDWVDWVVLGWADFHGFVWRRFII